MDSKNNPQAESSKRIQTSLLNAAEKKVLVWLASHMPKWVTADLMSAIGFVGSLMIAAGYILSNRNINWLWFSSLGFFVNWFGDSLDGTIARVRKRQRPLYGYYLDHTLDAVNEVIMFTGAGLSAMMHNFPLALMALILYLMITLNVSINAHLRSEFKLTYAKMGPTEFRIVMILINTLFIFIRPLREWSVEWPVFGKTLSLGALDIVAFVVIIVLAVIYVTTVSADLKYYNRIDPLPDEPKDK